MWNHRCQCRQHTDAQSFSYAKETARNFHLTSLNPATPQLLTHLQLSSCLISACVCVCVFILLLLSMASQFPWWIWNCWTCLVKAATVMGLIKTRGVERRSCGLAAAAALVACSAVGRDWMSREREREQEEARGRERELGEEVSALVGR